MAGPSSDLRKSLKNTRAAITKAKRNEKRLRKLADRSWSKHARAKVIADDAKDHHDRMLRAARDASEEIAKLERGCDELKAAIKTTARSRGRARTVAAHALKEGMLVRTPTHIMKEGVRTSLAKDTGRRWPKVLRVDLWDWEGGESLLVDPATGNGIDYNTVDYPRRFTAVG